jgi:protein-disulfide isomerase
MEQGDPTEAYYNFVKALFKTQDTWAFDQNFVDRLQAIALLDGMSQEQFKACIDDQKLQEKLLKARMITAKSLNLKSTPSFFINGEIFEGFVDYKSLKKEIDKKL